MCFLYSIFSKKNKEKGFSLLELLMAMGIAGSVSLLVTSISDINLRNLVSARMSMDEQQLYASLSKTIGDNAGVSCKGNLKPKAGNPPQTGSKDGVYGTNHANGVGDVEELYIFKSGPPLVRTGTPVIKIGDFGTNLKIIKMSLEDTDTSTLRPDSANPNEDRVFKVYYNHRKGNLKQPDSTCKGATNTTTAVTTGCFSMVCDMSPYEVKSGGAVTDHDYVKECKTNCELIHRPSSGGGGSGTVDCYEVDTTDPKGRTLVGCGSTTPQNKTNIGDDTTAFGYNAGNSESTGEQNTFIGNNVGSVNTTGNKNTFIGRNAGLGNKAGSYNTFIGRSAGWSNILGNNNTFIGHNVGGSNTTSENTFIGAESGANTSTGGSNTFLGYQAGYNTTTGLENVFIGKHAGFSNREDDTRTSNAWEKEASMNTYIGMNAGKNNTSSRNSVFIGYQSGLSSNGGQGNTFIGSDSGKVNTGGDNVFVGIQSGLKNVGANSNTFVGAYSGQENVSGEYNVFIGRDAGQQNTVANNTFIGTYSGKANTTGGGNTFIGRSAGVVNTTGADNVFIGKEAGEDNTTGDDNVFIGKGVGEHNKGGIDKAGSRQLNIGNLIFGRMPDMGSCDQNLSNSDTSGCTGTAKDDATSFINSTNTSTSTNPVTNYPLSTSTDLALVINGDLYVKGKVYAECGDGNGDCKETVPASSKVYKKNLTPFLDFNKALTDITTTPLFTYEYKKDHPNHQRMGIIAEDLPPHLQIKDQYEPVKPDWVSIYGTFWASIKALFNKVTNLTKSILRLNSITSSLKVNLYEVKEKLENLHGVKDRLEVLEKETQYLRNQNKELKKKIKSQDKKINTLNKKVGVSQ